MEAISKGSYPSIKTSTMFINDPCDPCDMDHKVVVGFPLLHNGVKFEKNVQLREVALFVLKAKINIFLKSFHLLLLQRGLWSEKKNFKKR